MILAALALAAAAAQSAAESPRAFVERVYAGYCKSDFSPFTRPERWFAPRLLAAIREDERLAQGEVGYLDGDPICQCQDSDGLRATVTKIVVQDRDHARVRVSIGLSGYAARPAALTLVRTGSGWRIADVSSTQETSLLAGLEASNAKIRAGARH